MTTREFQQLSPHTKLSNHIIFFKNNRYKDRSITFSDHSTKMDYLFERFSHACSHELREPMRSAANFIQLFSHRNKQLDEESLGHLCHIRQSIDRMDILIKDIACYLSIVEQTNHSKVAIDTNEIFYSIKEKFTKQLLENDGQFTIATLPTIPGVRTHIQKLFLNLVDNAFKFYSQKPVRINVFAIEQEKFWEFHVCDNGIGIESEYHESIFNMFSRLHHKDSYDGSGIGLAVCKEIIQKHHGKIEVKSVLGCGSEFIVTLPKGY